MQAKLEYFAMPENKKCSKKKNGHVTVQRKQIEVAPRRQI